MASLSQFRSEVKAQEIRVQRKLARLRREKGVTDFATIDPRREKNRTSRYNTKQLNAYMRELTAFTSRKTQYVGDSKGRPMSAKTFRDMKKAEKSANEQRKQFLKDIYDVKLPSGGKVGHFIEQFGPSQWKPNMFTDNLTMPSDRKPKSFTSQNALEKVKEYLTKEAENFQGKFVNYRKEGYEIFKTVGNDRLTKKFMSLNKRQLAILWSGTGFVNAAVSLYELVSMGRTDESENEWDRQMYEADTFDVEQLLNWANKL